MADGYTKAYSRTTGNTILASDFNTEFQSIDDAFSESSGHRHDNSADQGGYVPLISDLNNYNSIEVDTGNDEWDFNINVTNVKTRQIYLADGVLAPDTDSDVDLGTTLLRFKDAYIDTLTLTDAMTIGGDVTVTTNLSVNGNTVLGNAATDTVTVTADVASNLIPSADNSYDLGAVGSEWKDLYIDGTANIDSLVADTADINAGTVDGVTIGGASAGAITGTTIDATTDFTIGGTVITDNTITDDGTLVINATTAVSFSDGNITNVGNIALDSISADGAALSIDSNWDAAGVTCSNLGIVTTADLNGGTIDGMTVTLGATWTTSSGLQALTSAEVDQLENIGSSTISATQWGYLGGLDQALTTTSDPEFGNTTVAGFYVDGGSDQVQLEIDANAGQTADILRINEAGTADVFSITAAGRMLNTPQDVASIIDRQATAADDVSILLFQQDTTSSYEIRSHSTDAKAGAISYRAQHTFIAPASGSFLWGTGTNLAASTATYATLDSTGLVVGTGSGASAPGFADNLQVDGGSLTNVGLSFLSINTGNARIAFSDTDDDDVGIILYNHTLNDMVFTAGATTALTLNSTTTDVAGSLEVGGADITGAQAGNIALKTGDCGAAVTPDATADDLVIEGSGDTGITILTPNTDTGALVFGDQNSAAQGFMQYDHNSGDMDLGTVAISRMTISADENFSNSPFRFQSLTTTQRNALSASAGTVIFNTTTTKLQVFAGAVWVDLH